MYYIKSNIRLVVADKSVSELSDSSLRKIASNPKDKRQSQAKRELEKRSSSKPSTSSKTTKSSKPSVMNPLVRTYKGLSRWNTKRKINKLNKEEKNDLNTNNWFFGPTERDFEGNKYERKRKLNDYINTRRQEINRERDALTDKLDRLNKELS